jgi:FkbM family methyltransferase
MVFQVNNAFWSGREILLRSIQMAGRTLVRAWGRTAKAPGLYYQAVERWGKWFAFEPVKANLVNGCRMFCNLDDEVQRQIYFLGLYEPVESYLFTRILQPGMTVIDAGANVGQYTILAATLVGPDGQVHAFEPVPATFARLEQNVASNYLRNVHFCQAAVWHERKRLSLGISYRHMGNNAGGYTVTLPHTGAVVATMAIPLDDYVAEEQIDRVHVIKMDIEGAEMFALRGMRNLLRRDRPIIFMEVSRPLLSRVGHGPEQVWDCLAGEFGYRAWIIQQSASDCYPAENLNDVEINNVIFHAADLPSVVTEGWELKSVLRWARAGTGVELIA